MIKCPYCGGELEIAIKSIHDIRPYEAGMDGEKDVNVIITALGRGERMEAAVREIASGILPDGDHVPVSVVLYAESVLASVN